MTLAGTTAAHLMRSVMHARRPRCSRDPSSEAIFFSDSGLMRQARSGVEQPVFEADPSRRLVARSKALSIVVIILRERVGTADWA